MKIAGIQPLSLSDFPETPAAIIFTIGCNFRCPYCHNKNLWDDDCAQISEAEVLSFLEKKIGKLAGVVITGGEPTIQPKLENFLKKIKALGFKTKLNTNGSNPSLLKKLVTQKLLDFIAMDVKAPLDKYKKITGKNFSKNELKNIKESIAIIEKSGLLHEFRTHFASKWLAETDLIEIKKLIPTLSKWQCTESERTLPLP
jgi:pyruvate formate lyase activating enzyme